MIATLAARLLTFDIPRLTTRAWQEQPTAAHADALPIADILLGAALLAAFLLVAYLGGSIARAREMQRFRRLLAPHAALVNGTITGSPECITITGGSYAGRRVTLALSPHVVDGVFTESGQGSRVFDITLPDVDGAHDWAMEKKRTLTLARRWQLRAADPLLEHRLAASGLMNALPSVGIDSWVRFDARGRWLGARAEVQGARVPPLQTVQAQLDLLVRIDEEWHPRVSTTPHAGTPRRLMPDR